MDKIPNIVPKVEPVFDCDDDGVCLLVISSVQEEYNIKTEFKVESSSEEGNSPSGEFMEVEEEGYGISKFEVDEDLIQEKCDEVAVDPDCHKEVEEQLNVAAQLFTRGDQSETTPKDKSKLTKCPICHKNFLKLKRHMKIHSAPDQKCKTCGKMFSQNFNLMTHYRRVHLKEKCFKCSQCEKSFASKANLQCHLMSHSDQKPFQCLKCRANFKRRPDLQRHMKLHENDSNNGRMKCEICSRLVDNWDQHQRQHLGEEKGFPCEKCPKVYDTDKQLQSHVTNYHVPDDESCRCPKCQKIFAKPANMRFHLETVHSEERSFSCSFCDGKFKLKGTLNSHIKTVHGEKK